MVEVQKDKEEQLYRTNHAKENPAQVIGNLLVVGLLVATPKESPSQRARPSPGCSARSADRKGTAKCPRVARHNKTRSGLEVTGRGALVNQMPLSYIYITLYIY